MLLRKKEKLKTHQCFCIYQNWARNPYLGGTCKRSQQVSCYQHSCTCPELPNPSAVQTAPTRGTETELTPSPEKFHRWTALPLGVVRFRGISGNWELRRGPSASLLPRIRAILWTLWQVGQVCESPVRKFGKIRGKIEEWR